jgi:dipeptidyl-peptidase III
MSTVGLDYWGTKVRSVVLKNKQPRKVFVQGSTRIEDSGAVKLTEYEPTPEGMIKSWAERNL